MRLKVLFSSFIHSTTDTGAATWNLMSNNDQKVVSGIYLYSVKSLDDRFEDFVGKFVVVR